ncbi:MAG: hypothetical protein CM15mP22_4180 [Gammaproteobacteria bacterium]|nr:MAG: hypothetical protein CM15mP22_4180 [Gammaproteobacteria bacterium]
MFGITQNLLLTQLYLFKSAKLIQPGTGGSPFAQPVMWFGRPFGSAYPSPERLEIFIVKDFLLEPLELL